MANIHVAITLSAANLGPDADEAFFDAWAAYVTEHVETACNLPEGCTSVEQFRFGGGEPDDQVIFDSHGRLTVHDEENLGETVDRWLGAEGWEAFCAAQDEAGEERDPCPLPTPDGIVMP